MPVWTAVFSSAGMLKRSIPKTAASRRMIRGGNLDVASASDDDDAAKLVERGEVVGKVDVGEHFENHVGGDAVEVAGLAVVEDLVRALFADELEASFGAGSADDAESGSAGELDGGNAHAAAGTVDENSFTSFTCAF